jgi:hypothetical protein
MELTLNDTHRGVLKALGKDPRGAIAAHRIGHKTWELGHGGLRIGREDLRALADAGLVHHHGVSEAKIIISITDAGRDTLITDLTQWPTHQPRRGDAVEAWLTERRNDHRRNDATTPAIAVDDLLEEWRLRADTGTPLGEVVRDMPGRTE